ncbi:MAG: hypothetical protein WC364_15555, partial [Eubacteriales bacterium]
ELYRQKERVKFLEGEFDRGNFDKTFVDEWNAMAERPTDEEFNGLVDTWQQTKKQELVDLVSKVFTGFADIPEDKKYGAVTNYITTLYTDEATQAGFRETLLSIGRNPDTEALVKDIMPMATERDIKQLFGETVTPLSELTIGSYAISQQSLDDIYELGTANPEKLRLAFVSEGRNEQTEVLVKELYGDAATEDFINKYFSDVETDRRRVIEDAYFTHLPQGITRDSLYEKYAKDYPADIAEELTAQEMDNYQMFSNEAVAKFWITEPTEKAVSEWYEKEKGIPIGAQLTQYMRWRTGDNSIGESWLDQYINQFGAGFGDLATSVAGGLKWMGLENLWLVPGVEGTTANDLERWGQSAQLLVSDTQSIGEQMVRTLPSSLAFIPLAIAGALGGEVVAGALGLGKIGIWAFSSLGSVALSRPVESLMEVGSSYENLVAQYGKAEADKKALDIFKKNMALSGWDALQMATALAPLPKGFNKIIADSKLFQTVKVAGKTIVVGLTEGGEEVYQDIIQRQASGQEIKWDDQMKSVMMVGGLMGGIMGISGDIISSVNDKSRVKLSPKDQQRFAELQEQARKQGLSEDLAVMQAINELSKESNEAAKVFNDVIQDVQVAKPTTTLPVKEQEQITAVLNTDESKKLAVVIEKAKWGNGLYEDIPASVYKELTGEDAKLSQLTSDMLKVKSGEALKVLSKLYGYSSVDEFRVAINNYNNAQIKNEAMQVEELTVSKAETAEKQPWQMTRDEFKTLHNQRVQNVAKAQRKMELVEKYGTAAEKRQARTELINAEVEMKSELLDVARMNEIARAISDGKPVPPEVLKDYPDLAKTRPVQTTTKEMLLDELHNHTVRQMGSLESTKEEFADYITKLRS